MGHGGQTIDDCLFYMYAKDATSDTQFRYRFNLVTNLSIEEMGDDSTFIMVASLLIYNV